MTEKKARARRTQVQLLEKHRADAIYADAQALHWHKKAERARVRATVIENDIRSSFKALQP